MTKDKENLKNLLLYVKYNKISLEEFFDDLDNGKKRKMVRNMLELLDDEIKSFSYEDKRDITYLFVLLDVLSLTADEHSSKKRTVKELKNVHKEMKRFIHERPTDMDSNSLSRYKLLKNLIAKVEDTSLKFYINLPEDYDASKEEYISYIIFKSKNLLFFDLALEKFPYIINYKDKDDKPLIDRVLEGYLEALDHYLADINLGPIDDLMYFNKVFKGIMFNPKLHFEKADEERLLRRIQEYAKAKDYASNRQNEKLTYFVNNLFFIITKKKDETTLKDLDYEYEVHEEFKAANLSEAKKLYILHKDLKGAQTPRKIYTYDGEGAFELDDGISLTKKDGLYKLGIHIPNVPFYVPEESIIRTEARRRTRSLYVKDKCIPMLPFTLSKNLISLNTYGYKNVISFYYDIDELTGKLVNFDIVNETVKIYKNSTYNEFDRSFGNTPDPEYREFLAGLYKIYTFIKRDFNETEEYKALHNDNSKKTSTDVIASLMLFNGIQTARYFGKRELPFIFRCHQIDQKAVQEINALKERAILYSDMEVARYLEQLKDIYPKAFYTPDNVGHAGLGTEYYSHVGIPLRAYAAIPNLDAINKFVLRPYSTDDILRYKDEFARIAEDINSKRASLDSFESEYSRVLSKKHKP